MQQDRLTYLLTQYGNDLASPAEAEELFHFIHKNGMNDLLDATVADLLEKYEPAENAARLFPAGLIARRAYEIDKVKVAGNVLPMKHRISLRRWRWAVAAVFILLLGSGLYYFNNQLYKSHKSSSITVQTKDIAPGANKAIWTLTNGKQIELDSTVLDMTQAKHNTSDIGYNELRTPRGGQYQLILPDGSKVWLNAASSIKYPVAFDAKERRVEVTGEAYFEIEKDATKPFKVSCGGQNIEVLGTSFNMNVYDDEPIKKTTLLTGSIKITNNNQTAILQPGQQANVPILSILPIRLILVQTDDAIAWKNGYFNFTRADLATVLRQVARWYNIDIKYEGPMPAFSFSGKLQRSLNLTDVIQALEQLNITLRIEGRTLIVQQ